MKKNAAKKTDEFFMSEAIKLALKGIYNTHPNPMVGAVIVKNGRIIGKGYHMEYGKAHAEVNAIKSAKAAAKGATIYITLEPCSTFGKTPPCTEAIIKAGIKKVIVGAVDCNRSHSGKGFKILAKSGIKVETGVLKKSCEDMNFAFNKFMRQKIPYVTLKVSQSFDGRIADFMGRSRWISSLKSRIKTHELRAEADAVLAGIETIVKDNPMLNIRHLKVKKQPVIVIVDSSLRIGLKAKVLENERVIIATTQKASKIKTAKLEKRGIKVLVISKDKNGRVNLKTLLKKLGQMGIGHVFVEGGGRVLGSFVSQGLADRFMGFFSPMIIGGEKSKSSVVWPDILNKRRKDLGIKMVFKNIKQIGPDIMFEAEFKKAVK
ncbi:MAG: bifunctional diaminohydroxyphosphoribosylaminopyrimidine deaminase/5-amino-6-(5-phosphoribosylamino)uracil reductase RibD [Elusimicrobiales bacterium]|nr:bifunctional diaminohydroxyphosphoribosylaminopyrimidine deaminase/5-amino-6-(5-phosphoribosylamino)uracil reductase RibD [Elusimicrobiales bacterium]